MHCLLVTQCGCHGLLTPSCKLIERDTQFWRKQGLMTQDHQRKKTKSIWGQYFLAGGHLKIQKLQHKFQAAPALARSNLLSEM